MCAQWWSEYRTMYIWLQYTLAIYDYNVYWQFPFGLSYDANICIQHQASCTLFLCFENKNDWKSFLYQFLKLFLVKGAFYNSML